MEPFVRLTGRDVRVAIIDSGVNPSHPHVGGVAGGVNLTPGSDANDFVDKLGHGTAVAAAIREKAPESALYALRVFDRTLSTNITVLLRALEWCVAQNMAVVNLSLGTHNPQHLPRLQPVLEQLARGGGVLVTAREDAGQPLSMGSSLGSLLASIPGVVSVGLDWDCPRETYRCETHGRHLLFFASGYPRPAPGIPREQNLRGISFAVANMSGFVARACQASPAGTPGEILRVLAEQAQVAEKQR